MDSVGTLVFLFLALTLPTAIATFLLKREVNHYAVAFGWAVCVTFVVATCAGVSTGSVNLGNEWYQILERFFAAFGLSSFFFVIVGIVMGLLVADWQERSQHPRP